MTLTKNEKIAIAGGAAVVIIGGIAVAASKAKAAVTPPTPAPASISPTASISMSLAPFTQPYPLTGYAVVVASGSVTGIPDGARLDIDGGSYHPMVIGGEVNISGPVWGYATVSGGTYAATIDISAAALNVLQPIHTEAIVMSAVLSDVSSGVDSEIHAGMTASQIASIYAAVPHSPPATVYIQPVPPSEYITDFIATPDVLPWTGGTVVLSFKPNIYVCYTLFRLPSDKINVSGSHATVIIGPNQSGSIYSEKVYFALLYAAAVVKEGGIDCLPQQPAGTLYATVTVQSFIGTA